MKKEIEKTKEKILEKTENNTQAQEPKKKTNKTWEAFGKSKGCFIVNDPKFFL